MNIKNLPPRENTPNYKLIEDIIRANLENALPLLQDVQADPTVKKIVEKVYLEKINQNKNFFLSKKL